MLFSQRKGIKPFSVDIQIDTISAGLRNGLWDVVSNLLSSSKDIAQGSYISNVANETVYRLACNLWHSYFKQPVDSVPTRYDVFYQTIREYFFGAKWNEVYDLLEFLVKNYKIVERNSIGKQEARIEYFLTYANTVLERENSAYRFVERQITQITSNEEISSIEEAARIPFVGTQIHIQTALGLMSNRINPDFRNSIKESISAVEATCNHLLGADSKTLGQALNELERKEIVMLHKAEKNAFTSLYGYTSDSEGIRHALLEENNLDYDDAKFMLVSCSAFCNFLISKSKS